MHRASSLPPAACHVVSIEHDQQIQQTGYEGESVAVFVAWRAIITKIPSGLLGGNVRKTNARRTHRGQVGERLTRFGTIDLPIQ